MSAEKPGPLGAASEPVLALQRKLSLVDLLDPLTFGDVVESLGALYQVGVRVLDERGRTLADAQDGQAEFCGLMGASPVGRVRCSSQVTRVADGPLGSLSSALVLGGEGAGAGEVLLHTCFTGLSYVLVPVVWEDGYSTNG